MERFADVHEDEPTEILENRDSKNTKNVIKTSINFFKAFCTEKQISSAEFEQMSVTFLSKLKTYVNEYLTTVHQFVTYSRVHQF